MAENKKFSKIYQEMYHVTQDCYYGLKNSDGQFEIAWGVGLDNGYGNKRISNFIQGNRCNC